MMGYTMTAKRQMELENKITIVHRTDERGRATEIL